MFNFLVIVSIVGGALFAAYLILRSARVGATPMMVWRDLWTLEGEIDRGPYLAIGFCLMAFKYNLERLTAGMLFNRSWSVFAHYVNAPHLDTSRWKDGEADFYRLMVALSLPFIWTGVALTVRRLRSAGLPIALAGLFFVPFLNLLFILVLAALPARDAASPGASERFLDRLVPRSRPGAAVAVVLCACAVTLLAAWFSTSPIVSAYGAALFVGLPFSLGLLASLLYGHHEPRTLGECLAAAALSVLFACAVLFAAAVEGIICLLMAAPLALPLAAMGAGVGYLIGRRPRPAVHAAAMLAVLCGLPVLMGAESAAGVGDAARPLRTVVEVDAPPSVVWRNVVEFSELPAPSHPLFRFGFAYPVRATIKGRGVGAVRHCEFTTGAFIEPITVWDEPWRLAFDVSGQPPPMKESSWYPDLKPAHLEGFLISERGEFLLEELPGGRTRLTGTTWYRHEIAPSWYWRVWSDYVIHRIHERVLAHVKDLSEAKT